MKLSQATAFGSLLVLGAAFTFVNPARALAETHLGFAELKIACQNPAAYHNQVAPSNIQISCVDVQTKWIAEPNSVVQAENNRMVETSVTSDKYTVDVESTPIAMPLQAVNCSRFKEVSERVESIRSLSCADIISFTGDGAELCIASADLLRNANAAAIVSTDTGKTLDLCAQTAAAIFAH